MADNKRPSGHNVSAALDHLYNNASKPRAIDTGCARVRRT
jgi:hypothetical protein